MGATVTAPTKRARIKNGIYTGNGEDDRSIDIGVNLISKNNVLVTVASTGTDDVCIRPEVGQGDLAKPVIVVVAADHIQAITATGFQVGTNSRVNSNGVAYWYVAQWEN